MCFIRVASTLHTLIVRALSGRIDSAYFCPFSLRYISVSRSDQAFCSKPSNAFNAGTLNVGIMQEKASKVMETEEQWTSPVLSPVRQFTSTK